jgi:hypothetical protein
VTRRKEKKRRRRIPQVKPSRAAEKRRKRVKQLLDLWRVQEAVLLSWSCLASRCQADGHSPRGGSRWDGSRSL